MKYGFLTLCFGNELRTGKMDLEHVFKWAHENGFDGVEVYLPTLSDLSWHIIDYIRKMLKEYSLSVSQVSHETGFLCSHGESKRYCKRYYALAVEVASILEAKYIRAISGAEMPNVDEAVNLSADALIPILDLADDCDIYVTLENHPGVEKTLAVLSAIFHKCRSKRLKFNFDTVNSLTVGEDLINVLENLSHSLVHIHACDFINGNGHEKTIIGKGLVPWPSIMKIIKEINYTGYFSIEYFGIKPAQALVQSRDYLKTL